MLIGKDKERRFKPIKLPMKSGTNAEFFKKQQADNFKISESKTKTKQLHPNDEKKLKTRDLICNQLLKEGYIQSYIDMFYIANKTLPNVMLEQNYAQQRHPETCEDLTENDINIMNELASNLKKAEIYSSYTSSEKQKGMLQYTKLAENYELQGDSVTSAYFYNRVIEMAKAFNSKQHEVIASIGMSKCYDQEKQTDNAIRILEDALIKARELKKSISQEDLIKKISKDLIDIYMKLAEDYEKSSAHENALIFFQKCLQVARRSDQKQSQGKICYRIGQLYYKSENFQKSVEFQEKYLTIIKESKNSGDEGQQKNQTALKIKTMEAHASLAKCYLKMKWIQQTEQHLNEYNQLARQLKIQNALADSSFYLAKLNQQKGNLQKSIDYYKSYFEAAKAEKPDKKDRHLVDKGRAMFAIAKSNQNMQRYINMFKNQNSLKGVLDWKIKKQLK